jgi:hypothetical protein
MQKSVVNQMIAPQIIWNRSVSGMRGIGKKCELGRRHRVRHGEEGWNKN